MTKRVTPLLDDPSTVSGVRELLQAGRDANVTDYDYGSGLERHLAQVQAGAPMPEWAKGLEAPGTGVAATAAGSGLIGWLALPVATLAVVAAIGAVVLFRSPEPSGLPAGQGAGSARGTQLSPAVVPSAPIVAEPAAGAQSASASAADQSTASSARRAAARARSGAGLRTSQAKHAQAVANAQGASKQSSSSKPGDLFAKAQTAPTTQNAGNARTAAKSSASGTTVAAPAGKNEQAPAAEQAQPEAVAAAEQPGEAKPEPVPAMDDTRLEREMGMLSVAQRVLQVDPARTLALARQGESEFSGSMFTPERKQLELLALVKLGRIDEAKRLARPYLARYPNGPFSDRVRRALATGRVER